MGILGKAIIVTRSVCLLGKGDLAIRIARYLEQSLEFQLVGIVPVLPEPEWSSSLVSWASSSNVPIMTLDELESGTSKIDIAFSCFFDRILSEEFINRFSLALNLHNSPLPKYRGVNPINWALKNDEKFHGVTIHKITKGIDDGPIYGQLLFNIDPEVEEVVQVYNRAIKYGYLLFEDVFDKLDLIRPKEQCNSESSYYSKKDFDLLGDRKGITRTNLK